MNNQETSFEELLEMHEPQIQDIARSLKETIISLHPDYVELIWPKQNIASYGVGPKKMSQHYVYIGLFSEHVNLGFYNGAILEDPENLLEGTGKKLRHIKVKNVDQISHPEIIKLINYAIKDKIQTK